MTEMDPTVMEMWIFHLHVCRMNNTDTPPTFPHSLRNWIAFGGT